MSRATAVEFDAQLSAIPLFVRVGGELMWNPDRERFTHEWAQEHGVTLEAPEAARALGCRNCRQGDRLRHPELPHATYCDMCPILTLGLEAAVGPELPGGSQARKKAA